MTAVVDTTSGAEPSTGPKLLLVEPKASPAKPKAVAIPPGARLLTCAQVAEALGVSERLVRALVGKKDGIKTIRIGKCVRIPRDELERVLVEGV